MRVSFWVPDLALDLGTSTTRVVSTSGRALEGPSTADGVEALRGGVIVDREAASAVVGPLLDRLRRGGWMRPRVVASVPTDALEGEREAVIEVVRRAGAKAVALVPEPLAAAVGSGVDVGAAAARLVLDVGHGVTDAVVVRSGAVVAAAARRVGCGDLETALAAAVEARIGLRPAARARRDLLRAIDFDPTPHAEGSVTVTVEGRRDPVEVFLESLAPVVAPLHDAILAVAERLAREVPDDVGAELVENGIWVTGGGALLTGLAASLARRTRLDVRRVGEPLNAVVRGNRLVLTTVARLGSWDWTRKP